MKRIYKYLSWTILTVIILNLGFYIITTTVFSGAFEKHYSVDEAIQNYNEREKEILGLADFLKLHKPPNHEVFFSAEKRSFDLSIGLPRWAIMEKFPNIHGNDLKLGTPETDTLLSSIAWTNNIVTDLLEKLKKADCISISSNEGFIDIHYRTGTWISYSYIVFDKPISDSLRKVYKGANVRMLRDNVKLAMSNSL